MYALKLCLALAFNALASTFELTAPVPGSTIDLCLIFGGADFAGTMGYPILVADLEYFWDAEDTANGFAQSNVIFYSGSPFQIAAFSYTSETPAEFANSSYIPPTPTEVAINNYSITNYPGRTSNATGPPSSRSSAFASRFSVPAWNVAAGILVISGWASLI